MHRADHRATAVGGGLPGFPPKTARFFCGRSGLFVVSCVGTVFVKGAI